MRSHRSLLQRILYAEKFSCRKCGYELNALHAGIRGTLSFFSSKHSQCLACGNRGVQRLSKRDRIDSMSRHPFSLLIGLTGAPINRCPICRLQYRDWRRPESQGH